MAKISVVGLGPGDYGSLTVAALETIKSAKKLIFRTEKHPTVDYIKKLGIDFSCCDDIYDNSESFEQVYQEIGQRVVKAAQEYGDVVYAVPGHPMVAEKSVENIIKAANNEIEVVVGSAVSFIDAILTLLNIDPSYGLKIIDGLSMDHQKPDISCGNIITQVYDKFAASDVKLRLMDYYNDEFKIYIIKAAGVPQLEKVEEIYLYELDRIDWVDYLTSIYVPAVKENPKHKSLDDLVSIMDQLRAEDGCPWDKEQTRESLRPYLLEEAYEVLDAIEKNDVELLQEELGDLLLQVIFHSQIAKEDGEFDIRDVITGIVDKLVIRHPHVFGDTKATSESGALRSWEKAKREQKGIEEYTKMLTDIPEVLPTLMRSYKVQQKAALAGFDWENVEGAMEKLEEELRELKEVYKSDDKKVIEEELGDLLFSVVNVSRFYKIQPELALKATIEKFIKRFAFIEKTALKLGKKIDKMSLNELDELWNLAKSTYLEKK